MNLEVLYEDNHLLVVNKPAGLLTQPSGTLQDSLESYAKEWIKQKYQKPGNVYLHAVHRLDRPVSGIVLFARTSKALSRLNALMRDKKSQKIYYALVEGKLAQAEGRLEHFLVHDDHQARVATKNSPEAKLASLAYKTLNTNSSSLTLLEIHLETGRYHQIRAQFAAIGCPIVGDQRYGSRRLLQSDQIALHHRRLEIDHPVTGQRMIFEAPVPSYWPAIST